MGKSKIVQFHLFPQCFPKAIFFSVFKWIYMEKRVKRGWHEPNVFAVFKFSKCQGILLSHDVGSFIMEMEQALPSPTPLFISLQIECLLGYTGTSLGVLTSPTLGVRLGLGLVYTLSGVHFVSFVVLGFFFLLVRLRNSHWIHWT